MKTSLALSPTVAHFAPLFHAGHLRRGLELAARLGYDGVELNLRDSDELDQAQILAWITDLALAVPSIGTGQSFFVDQLSLCNPDPTVQQAVRQRMEGHIRFAARLGARVVLGSIRGRTDRLAPPARPVSYATALEATRRIAEYAQTLGVELLVEPINRYETDLLNTIGDALAFIQQVGAPNLGIVADTFHMNIEEASLTASLAGAGSYLWHVHWVDSNRRAAGMGHLDFPAMLATLRAIGYAGYLSAEVLPWPDDDTAAECWLATTRHLLAEVELGNLAGLADLTGEGHGKVIV